MDFLPISKDDMHKRGWSEVDFVYVSGDAYIDPLLEPLLLQDFLRATVLKSGLFHSLIGKVKRVLMYLVNPDFLFLFLAEI